MSMKMENDFDECSAKYQFGWTTIAQVFLPYIKRKTTLGEERFCAARMVELRLKLSTKMQNIFTPEINNCINLQSYLVTRAEMLLLDNINVLHCNYQFGKALFNASDLIIKLDDVVECHEFLMACYNKLDKDFPMTRCGFIRIDKKALVPYTTHNNQRYLPVFYFEGELDNLKQDAILITGWDLSYLKFCFAFQGIRKEHYTINSCLVVCLDVLKKYFPSETIFEDFWPKDDRSGFLLKNKSAPQVQNDYKIYQNVSSPQTHSDITKTPLVTDAHGLPSAEVIQKQVDLLNCGQDKLQRLNVNNSKIVLPNIDKVVYKIQKTVVEDRNINCVNMIPYNHTELLISLKDLADMCFRTPIELLRKIIEKLQIQIYEPTLDQKRLLMLASNKKLKDGTLPLVKLRDIKINIVALKKVIKSLVTGSNKINS